MNVNKINLKNISLIQKFAKTGEIGEGWSIACDFIGKAVIVPAVIMGVSKEPKEKKEYSAFKNPVAAVIQLFLEVPVLIGGSKIVETLADKGYFDKTDSGFSYNQKKFKEEFLNVFEKNIVGKTGQNKNKLIEKIKTQGYSKQIAQEFDDFIKTADSSIQKELIPVFKKFETTYKNQFHLKNRICFLGAIILTPLLCAIENYLHPKIMKKIYNYEYNHQKIKPHHKFLNINQFIEKTGNKKR